MSRSMILQVLHIMLDYVLALSRQSLTLFSSLFCLSLTGGFNTKHITIHSLMCHSSKTIAIVNLTNFPAPPTSKRISAVLIALQQNKNNNKKMYINCKISGKWFLRCQSELSVVQVFVGGGVLIHTSFFTSWYAWRWVAYFMYIHASKCSHVRYYCF